MLCGTGRRCINPEIGHPLGGYGPHPNTGVHDDIAVTALYLADGDAEALLLSYDLIAIREPLNRQIRQAVSEAASVDPERVLLTTTHVHSGPETRTGSRRHADPYPGIEDYCRRLSDWSVHAAQEARFSGEPCVLRYNFAHVAESMNRRFMLPDRRAFYIPEHKQLAGLSDQFVDRELGMLFFRKEGTSNQYKAALTNYAAHPLCVGNASNLVTADYQGFLRRTVEETFAGCQCVTTTGAAGDQHPLRPESGFSEARRMGETLGSVAVMRAYDSVAAQYDQKLRMCWKEISLQYKDEATRAMLPAQAARERLPYGVEPGQTEVQTSFALLGIGPILLAAVPGELVSELGAIIKWSSPFLKAYILFQSTDAIGYIAARNQYCWGNYEPNSSRLAAGEGEKLANAIVDAACGLVQEQPLNLPAVE